MLQLVEPKMQRSPACSSAVAGNMWSTLSQLAQWHIQAAQGCFNGLYLKEQFRFQDNKVMFCLIVLKPPFYLLDPGTKRASEAHFNDVC